MLKNGEMAIAIAATAIAIDTPSIILFNEAQPGYGRLTIFTIRISADYLPR
jgi:hypothetical protein